MHHRIILLLLSMSLAVAAPLSATAGPGKCKKKTDMRAFVEVSNLVQSPDGAPQSDKHNQAGLRDKFKPRDKSSVFHQINGNQYIIQGCRTLNRMSETCEESIVLNVTFDAQVNKKPTLSCGGEIFASMSGSTPGGVQNVLLEAVSCEVRITKFKKNGKRLAGTFEGVFIDGLDNEIVLENGCFKSKGQTLQF